MFHKITGKILCGHMESNSRIEMFGRNTQCDMLRKKWQGTPPFKNLISAAKYGEGGDIVLGWFMPQGLDRCFPRCTNELVYQDILHENLYKKTESVDPNLIDMLWYDLMRAIHINLKIFAELQSFVKRNGPKLLLTILQVRSVSLR